ACPRPPDAGEAASNGPITGGAVPPGEGVVTNANPDGSAVSAPASEVAYGRSSIRQSCGTSSLRQARSSKPGAWAPCGSPRVNSQSSSKETSVRAGAPVCLWIAVAPAVSAAAASASRRVSTPSARVHRLDRIGVLRRDRPALELHRRRQLVAAGEPVALDDRELLDLLDPREMRVGLIDGGLHSLDHLRVAGERGEIGVLDPLLARPCRREVRIEHDQRR